MEQIYKPKGCAFHPKELIFYFSKNYKCLLPLSLVHQNSHQRASHRADIRPVRKLYLSPFSIHKVTYDVHAFFDATTKELSKRYEEITDQKLLSAKEQYGVKKRIQEAKAKMLTIV